MSEGWVDVVELHKREMRRIMTEIWRRYDRIPRERRKQAMDLIEAWFNNQLEYEELLKRLEQLAGEDGS
ncbi:MAG: hypothetical protein GSR86_07660 [Desulfurococcales archaeon]|nr:hypothetical protein [Desulfurococcales archaeon]